MRHAKGSHLLHSSVVFVLCLHANCHSVRAGSLETLAIKTGAASVAAGSSVPTCGERTAFSASLSALEWMLGWGESRVAC